MARIRFHVLVNGNSLCTAGIEGNGDVTVTAAYVYHQQPSKPPESLFGESRDIERCDVRVSGMPIFGEPSEWLRRQLHPGDEITIRVLGPGAPDPPAPEPPEPTASTGDEGLPF